MISIKEIDKQFSSEESISKTLSTNFELNNHPGFLWKHATQGYKDFTFGARSGPAHSISALAHELAHAIEFGAKSFEYRAKPYGRFNFQVPSIWVIDRYCCEPQTGQITEREARTFGIELRLLELILNEEVHKESYFDYCCSVKQYLPDYYFYSKKDEEFLAIVRSSYEKFTKEVCLKELKRWFEKTHLTLSLASIRQKYAEFA